MKRLLWLGLLTVLPASNVFSEISATTGEIEPTGHKQPIDHSQDGPLGMYYIPKWYGDAMVAANCYQTGMSYLTSNPKLAVQAFELGLRYAGKAVAEGGGASPESISLAISKELKIAMANLAKEKNDSNDTAKNDGSANDNNSNGNNDSENQNQGASTTAPKTGVISPRTSGNSYRLGSVANNNALNPGRSRAGM